MAATVACVHGVVVLHGLCSKCFGAPLKCQTPSCTHSNNEHYSNGICSVEKCECNMFRLRPDSDSLTNPVSKDENKETTIVGNNNEAQVGGKLDTFKSEMMLATKINGGKRARKFTKEFVSGLLQRHAKPGDDSTKIALAAFLDSPVGDLIVALIASGSINLAGGLIGSKLKVVTQEQLDRVASYIRVSAYVDGQDQLLTMFVDPFMEQFGEMLKDMPMDDRAPLLDGKRVTLELPEGLSPEQRSKIERMQKELEDELKVSKPAA